MSNNSPPASATSVVDEQIGASILASTCRAVGFSELSELRYRADCGGSFRSSKGMTRPLLDFPITAFLHNQMRLGSRLIVVSGALAILVVHVNGTVAIIIEPVVAKCGGLRWFRQHCREGREAVDVRNPVATAVVIAGDGTWTACAVKQHDE